MRRALRLAARGQGTASPNPMVGATVVAGDGTIRGDGWHRSAGTPHAEIHALSAAGAGARGATLVCTLEPCCHHGRTGPCTDAIVEAGIVAVVAAVEDPDPRVAGEGFRRLESRGVRVTHGVCQAEAAALNRAFFMAKRESRPWVTFKAGVSADGRVASAPGERTAITSTASLRRVQRLRAEVDAVAVGTGTLAADDPVLTVRDVFRARPLTRVVFDRRLRTPTTCRLLGTLAAGPVLIITTEAGAAGHPGRVGSLESAGAEVVVTDGSVAGGLRELARRGVQSVLLEGGPRLLAAFRDAGMIDEVRLFVAQGTFLPDGVPLTDGGDWPLAALDDLEVEPVGDDVLMRGYVHRPR